MPTGYTSDVSTGEITTLKAYALRCARAFGATVQFRDDPLDLDLEAEIAELGSDDIRCHTRRLAEAKQDLKRIKNMPLGELKEEAEKENAEELLRYEETVREEAEELARYQAMIDKVEAWEAPTPDHYELKNFMLSQLRESIQFDCGSSRFPPTPMTPAEYYASKLEHATRQIHYHETALAKAIEQANTRRKWLTDLIESVT